MLESLVWKVLRTLPGGESRGGQEGWLRHGQAAKSCEPSTGHMRVYASQLWGKDPAWEGPRLPYPAAARGEAAPEH